MLSFQDTRWMRCSRAKCGQTNENGCLRQILPLITILHPKLNIKGRGCGSSREIYLWNGSPNRPHLCCGSTENVRPSVPWLLPDIDRSELFIAGSGKSVHWSVITCQ